MSAAAAELLASASGCLARGDMANAAQSLIYVADIRRMQSQWDAALVVYGQAEALARQTQDRALLGKTLIGEARAAGSQRDYGAALASAREAVQVTEGLQNKKLRSDTYQVLADIQVKLGDFAAASDTVSKAMAAAKDSGSALNVYYALTSRAEIWMGLADRCDTRPDYQPCLQQIEKAGQDYGEARDIAAWARLLHRRFALYRRVSEIRIRAAEREQHGGCGIGPLQAEGAKRRAGDGNFRHLPVGKRQDGPPDL